MNQKHKPTRFQEKWGMLAADFAKSEGLTTTDSIHMRIHNFGTPYQRAKAPSDCEILHNKTAAQVALELDVHPQTILSRVALFADAYREPVRGGGNMHTGKDNWQDPDRKRYRMKLWLHPDHPDYTNWRNMSPWAERLTELLEKQQNRRTANDHI